MTRRETAIWLHCYPPAWRARYATELEALVIAMSEGGGSSWGVRRDLLRSGARERLRGAGLSSHSAPRDRAQGGVLLVLAAWVAFVVAGCALQKFSEHWQATTPAAAQSQPAAAFGVLAALAALGSALVLGGAALLVPRFVTFLRGAGGAEVRAGVLRAVGFSGATALATGALVVWAHQLDGVQRDGHDLPYSIAFLGWAGLAIAALAAWAAVAIRVVRSVGFDARLCRLEAWIAVAVASSMLAMTIAALVWWASLAHRAPWVLHGLPVGTSASGVALVPLCASALMLLASALAITGSAHALRSSAELESR